MNKRPILAVVVLMWAITVGYKVVMADDYITAVGAGGLELRKTGAISMKSEQLTISKDKVKVKYVFSNQSGTDIESLVAFPLPPIQCGEFDRQETVSEFEVRINGKRITPRKEIRAYEEIQSSQTTGGPYPGKDISQRIQNAGLPLNCLEVIHNPQLMKRAKETGLVGPPSEPLYFKYQTGVQYYWNQRFPAKSEIIVEHEYKPVLGSGASGLHYANEYALNWSQDIHANPEGHISDVDGYIIIKFILKTARSWDGPIRQFTLRIISPDENHVVGCSLGPLRHVDPLTFEVSRKDFNPENDLTVIFGNKRGLVPR